MKDDMFRHEVFSELLSVEVGSGIGKIRLAPPFVEEYIMPLVSSGNYMIKGTREVDARYASNDGLLPQNNHSANI